LRVEGLKGLVAGIRVQGFRNEVFSPKRLKDLLGPVTRVKKKRRIEVWHRKDRGALARVQVFERQLPCLSHLWYRGGLVFEAHRLLYHSARV